MPKTILEVIDLKKHFTQRKGLLSAFKEEQKTIPAVDGVSFYLKENETVGLVGESGCGKTTIGRTILRLEKPTSGKIIFDGKDITSVPTEELRRLRGQMQMIFQDLDAALNPKMRIREILKEAITVHHPMTDAEADKRTGELLEMVNLKKSKLSNYPHELSGGEKRRVGVARVLYVGKIVEMGLAERIAHTPHHPYTHVLWSSLVDKQNKESVQKVMSVQAGRWGVFDFERPTSGCRFAPRCPVTEAKGRPRICTDPETEPQLRDLGGGEYVSCHFPL